MLKSLVIAVLLIYVGVINYTKEVETVETVELSFNHSAENCQELIDTYEELVTTYEEQNVTQEQLIAHYQKIVDSVDDMFEFE